MLPKKGALDSIFNLKDQHNPVDSSQLMAAYSKRVERTTIYKLNPFPETERNEALEERDPTLIPESIDHFESRLY